MKDDITQSDGFASGMVAATALGVYPVVRGVAGAVGGAIDAMQRQGIVSNSAELIRHATDLVGIVRPKLEAIDKALEGLGIANRREVQMAIVYIEDRAQWFSAANIRAFVEANNVLPLVLLNEMAGFLVEPLREAIEAVRKDLGASKAGLLRSDLRDLELLLVKFAAEKFKADISMEHEPNYLVRKSLTRIVTVGGLIVVALAAFFGMILMTG